MMSLEARQTDKSPEVVLVIKMNISLNGVFASWRYAVRPTFVTSLYPSPIYLSPDRYKEAAARHHDFL